MDPEALNRLTRPLEPTLTVTRLGTVWLARKLILDEFGRGCPVGHTVTKDGAVVLVTATLSTTAATPLAGIPPAPSTVRLMDWPGPTLACGAPIPLRVSRIRAGTRLV